MAYQIKSNGICAGLAWNKSDQINCCSTRDTYLDGDKLAAHGGNFLHLGFLRGSAEKSDFWNVVTFTDDSGQFTWKQNIIESIVSKKQKKNQERIKCENSIAGNPFVASHTQNYTQWIGRQGWKKKLRRSTIHNRRSLPTIQIQYVPAL